MDPQTQAMMAQFAQSNPQQYQQMLAQQLSQPAAANNAGWGQMKMPGMMGGMGQQQQLATTPQQPMMPGG